MRIIDIPEYRDRKQLFTMEKETLLIDAVKKMKELNCGAVMVTEDNKLCGIFTERDLLIKVVGSDLKIKGLKLADVMTSNIQTAHVDDDVYESMSRMTRGKFRHLPVIDNNGALVGIISQGDFISVSWQQLFEQLKNKTKASFLTFTQIWMLVLGLIGYSVLMYLLFAWLEK
jgi:CBS domain-containing protein